MTYALTIAVKLLPADTGLSGTLLAKIYDSARVLQVTTVAGVGWTETGGGEYIFVYSSFADNLLGSIDFYDGAVFQTSTAFQPPDANVISISGDTSAADNLELMTKTGGAGAALHLTTLDATGAVLFGSTFDITGTTTLNALTVTNATTLNTLSATGAVSFGTVFNIGGMAIESLVSDQVWNELIAGHLGLGSTGAALGIASGLSGGVNVISIAGDTAAATNLKNALQGDSQNVATKGTDLDNLKTVKDTITGQISTKTIMSIDQLKNVLGV